MCNSDLTQQLYLYDKYSKQLSPPQSKLTRSKFPLLFSNNSIIIITLYRCTCVTVQSPRKRDKYRRFNVVPTLSRKRGLHPFQFRFEILHLQNGRERRGWLLYSSKWERISVLFSAAFISIPGDTFLVAGRETSKNGWRDHNFIPLEYTVHLLERRKKERRSINAGTKTSIFQHAFFVSSVSFVTCINNPIMTDERPSVSKSVEVS